MEPTSHVMNLSFADEVEARSRTRFRRCLFCLCCSGGCPFYDSMDFGPHGILRRVILGLKEEVLTSNTIWRCVGCHTCSAICPMAIDIAHLMDVLRNMALEQGTVADPAIVGFHREVLDSIERHGRTHKLEIMLRYKARTGTWFQDVGLGLRMLARRKLDLTPSRIKDRAGLRDLFQGVKGETS